MLHLHAEIYALEELACLLLAYGYCCSYAYINFFLKLHKFNDSTKFSLFHFIFISVKKYQVILLITHITCIKCIVPVDSSSIKICSQLVSFPLKFQIASRFHYKFPVFLKSTILKSCHIFRRIKVTFFFSDHCAKLNTTVFAMDVSFVTTLLLFSYSLKLMANGSVR